MVINIHSSYQHVILFLKHVSYTWSKKIFIFSPLKLTLNRLEWGVSLRFVVCGFSKNVSSKEILKPWNFETFNIIISHIFPESFIEISQVIQKIWRISLSLLTVFIDFLDFFTFPWWCQHFFTFNILYIDCLVIA